MYRVIFAILHLKVIFKTIQDPDQRPHKRITLKRSTLHLCITVREVKIGSVPLSSDHDKLTLPSPSMVLLDKYEVKDEEPGKANSFEGYFHSTDPVYLQIWRPEGNKLKLILSKKYTPHNVTEKQLVCKINTTNYCQYLVS